MMIKLKPCVRNHSQEAFSQVEAVVGMAVLGTFIVAAYASISSWFSAVEATRENLRATQILMEKMETVRLYNWNQLTVSNVPPYTKTFIEYYDYKNKSGFPYLVTVSVDPISLGTTYDDSLCEVTATAAWTNTVPRSRTVRTLVSRHGMQNTFISK